MAKMIDLGKEYGCTSYCDDVRKPSLNKKSYPCLYISGVGFPIGEFTATIKGKVIMCRDPSEGDGACELEVYAISEPSIDSKSLEDAMDDIAEKKSMEDDEEYED